VRIDEHSLSDFEMYLFFFSLANTILIIVIAAVVVLVLLAALLFFFLYWKPRHATSLFAYSSEADPSYQELAVRTRHHYHPLIFDETHCPLYSGLQVRWLQGRGRGWLQSLLIH